MKSNLFFKLFTNCIVSKGQNRSVIIDLQRETFTIIPDTMQDIIAEFERKKSIFDIYELYGDENITVIDEYIEFLIDNEFGVITDANEFDSFIDMNKIFELPNNISNCIIEVSDITLLHFDTIIKSLDDLLCDSVQIISYDELELPSLKQVLYSTIETKFKSLEIVLKYSDKILEFIPEIDSLNFRVCKLTLHSSESIDVKNLETTFDVCFIDHAIESFINCGIIDSNYFNVNNSKVFESLNYNSCLNKKISIDKDGNIKNCPSMSESFGNIKDTTLEEALNHPNFKKYWNINKDQIEVCKDCEFRHICTDCRAYIEEPNNIYSKPLKCGYNPYTNEWSEWSTNPLKQKAIEFYGMQDLIKKDA